MSTMAINRPLWAKVAEVAWQTAFYTGLGIPQGEIMRYLTDNVFGGDVRLCIRLMFALTKGLASIFALIVYSSCYYFQIPAIEKYRIQEWVWNKPKTPRTEAYMLMFSKTIVSLLVGEVATALFYYYLVGYLLKDKPDAELAQYIFVDYPGIFENFWKIMAGILFFEVIFYWGHRFLHTKMGYPFHKSHHAYYVTTSAAGSWGHFIDGLISFPIPGVVPVFLFDYHFITMWTFNIVLGFHTHYDHCGYDFPFNPMQFIPFGSHTAAHNFHHSHLHANFALHWRFMDTIFGTEKMWIDHINQMKEREAKVLAGEKDEQLYIGKDGQILVRTYAEEHIKNGDDDNLLYTIKSNALKGEAAEFLQTYEDTKKDN